MFQDENLFDQEIIRENAEFHRVEINFSENEEWVTVSTPAPKTDFEYGRNLGFWLWLFGITMRNPLMFRCVRSCEFLPPKAPGEKNNAVKADVVLTISVHGGIILAVSKEEFDRLKSLGLLACLEEARGDSFPYRLRLGGNVLSVQLKK